MHTTNDHPLVMKELCGNFIVALQPDSFSKSNTFVIDGN